MPQGHVSIEKSESERALSRLYFIDTTGESRFVRYSVRTVTVEISITIVPLIQYTLQSVISLSLYDLVTASVATNKNYTDTLATVINN